MTLMNLILFFYFFMIQFKGVTSERVSIYSFSRVGQDSTLPCDRVAQQGPTCSGVDWYYYRDQSQFRYEVWYGTFQENSPRSSRLRLNTDCSLIVHNVTDEDSGRYTCGLSGGKLDTYVYLSVFTVSLAPLTSNPKKDGQITLECTLWRHYYTHFCPKDSFLWLNEKGTVLSGDGITQNNCVSSLTVERQSEHRKYTCQYVLNNTVQISADYTLENPGSTDPKVYIYIGVGAVAALLVLLFVVVVFFKIRAKRNSAETTEDTEGAAPEMVEYENFSPGSVSEDSTYQSLCPATRDPDQVYSQLRPQPQDRVRAPPGGRKS